MPSPTGPRLFLRADPQAVPVSTLQSRAAKYNIKRPIRNGSNACIPAGSVLSSTYRHDGVVFCPMHVAGVVHGNTGYCFAPRLEARHEIRCRPEPLPFHGMSGCVGAMPYCHREKWMMVPARTKQKGHEIIRLLKITRGEEPTGHPCHLPRAPICSTWPCTAGLRNKPERLGI